MRVNRQGARVRAKWTYVEDSDRFGLLAAAIVSSSAEPATLGGDERDSDEGHRWHEYG